MSAFVEVTCLPLIDSVVIKQVLQSITETSVVWVVNKCGILSIDWQSK